MVEYHSRISYNNNCFATYILFFFFFNDTATTEIYTLPLHDALPISDPGQAAIRHAAQAAERDAANLAVRDQTEAADPDAFERPVRYRAQPADADPAQLALRDHAAQAERDPVDLFRAGQQTQPQAVDRAAERLARLPQRHIDAVDAVQLRILHVETDAVHPRRVAEADAVIVDRETDVEVAVPGRRRVLCLALLLRGEGDGSQGDYEGGDQRTTFHGHGGTPERSADLRTGLRRRFRRRAARPRRRLRPPRSSAPSPATDGARPRRPPRTSADRR